MRDLLRASYDADLIKGADFGAQAAMHAEDFAVDDGAEDEEVEDLTAGFPDGGVAVLGLAFFVETVDLGYLTGFVVAANEGDSIGVSDIQKLASSEDMHWLVFTYRAFRQRSNVNVSRLK